MRCWPRRTKHGICVTASGCSRSAWGQRDRRCRLRPCTNRAPLAGPSEPVDSPAPRAPGLGAGWWRGSRSAGHEGRARWDSRHSVASAGALSWLYCGPESTVIRSPINSAPFCASTTQPRWPPSSLGGMGSAEGKRGRSAGMPPHRPGPHGSRARSCSTTGPMTRPWPSPRAVPPHKQSQPEPSSPDVGCALVALFPPMGLDREGGYQARRRRGRRAEEDPFEDQAVRALNRAIIMQTRLLEREAGRTQNFAVVLQVFIDHPRVDPRQSPCEQKDPREGAHCAPKPVQLSIAPACSRHTAEPTGALQEIRLFDRLQQPT